MILIIFQKFCFNNVQNGDGSFLKEYGFPYLLIPDILFDLTKYTTLLALVSETKKLSGLLDILDHLSHAYSEENFHPLSQE